MRTAQRQGTRGAVRSRTSSLPPPVGGLERARFSRRHEARGRDPARQLLPAGDRGGSACRVRSHATFTGDCESVIVYNGLTATKLFVAVNTTNDLIIDATSGGAISTAVVGGAGAHRAGDHQQPLRLRQLRHLGRAVHLAGERHEYPAAVRRHDVDRLDHDRTRPPRRCSPMRCSPSVSGSAP